MSDLNNILKKYAVGESLGIKVKEPKKVKSFSEDFNMIINYKEKTISMENMNLTRSINDIIDYKTGKKSLAPSAEALVPMKVITTLNAASLLKKGYTLKGVDEKQMKMIIQEDDSKSFLRRYSDLVNHYNFNQEAFNRMDGTIFVDDNGELGIEYVQNPGLFTSKLVNLYAHNNEIIYFYYSFTNVWFAWFSGLAIATIAGAIPAVFFIIARKLFTRLQDVVNIWFYSKVFSNVREIEKRYIDSASSVALAKYFLEVLEDLEEQADKKNEMKDKSNFMKAKAKLVNYIKKEEDKLAILKVKILSTRVMKKPTK